jgi:hypothetical protein
MINIEGQLSFPLAVGAYIRARDGLAISLAYIQLGRMIDHMISTCSTFTAPRGREGGSQHPVEGPGYDSLCTFSGRLSPC